MKTLPRNTILAGDARERLSELLAESVDCVVTSPPYFRLRDYGAAGQLGREPTVDAWVANVRAVLPESAARAQADAAPSGSTSATPTRADRSGALRRRACWRGRSGCCSA